MKNVCNAISVFICPSINITYHRQNIIYNSIGELTVTVIFAVILFQLSLEYTDRVIPSITPSVIF
jgi:hypothetical protein